MGAKLYIAAFLSGLTFQAAAQMDSASQNLLIDKLDKVYLHLSANDPSKVPVTLRLADLYAERARQESMKADDGCVSCAKPKSDREKALRLYGEVVDKAPENARGKITLQMGHLHQMNGDDAKAITYYTKNLKDPDAALVTESQMTLGELYFKRREFAKAVPFYDQVLQNTASPSRSVAAYRRAWSYFHLGQVAQATAELEKSLSTPELLYRGSLRQVDKQFKEEVARDLVTFMAKDTITQPRLEKLYTLSPENTRVANLLALGYELERLSRKDEALMTWKYAIGYLTQPSDRLAANLSLAQLSLDKGDKPAALSYFEKATTTWNEAGVKGQAVETELKRRARNFPVAWNQLEKTKPSPELIAAYEFYLSIFTDDIDAHLYVAQIASDQKNYEAAWKHYSAARDLLVKNSGADKGGEKLESVLLSSIEVAESANNDQMEQAAYDAYIAQSSKKTKLLEVQYQKARALYDKGDYPAASELLRELAVNPKADAKIRKQSADLALDAVVLMKDEVKLIAWAKDFEKAFPENPADFSAIVQKTVLNRAANLAERDPAGALAALGDFNPAKSSPEDKIKFYKNKMILAERQGQIKEAAAAADALLALEGVSKEDRELAWGRKAYFAELRLDFSTAFAATEKLSASMPVDEKSFKMAVFAELSGKPSAPFYLDYLSKTKDDERKRLVAAELVRKSKNPEADLEKVKGMLAAEPVLLAQLYAEVFAKNGKEATMKKVTGDPKLAATDPGRLLTRQAFLKEFAAVKKPLVNDKMDTTSNGKLAASIKRRAALLSKVDAIANKAIQNGDWTAQLVSIDLVARESERFYQDLLSAPVPPGLTPEEEQEYLGLLSNQALPYQNKASEAKAKVAQFWQNADWSKALNQSWDQKALRPVITAEIEALKEIAPEDQVAKLNGFKDEAMPVARPSLQDLQLARQKVFDNPMDRTALEQLLKLEKKSENVTMTEYLATRLERLTKGTL